jgi:hypothetical protein
VQPKAFIDQLIESSHMTFNIVTGIIYANPNSGYQRIRQAQDDQMPNQHAVKKGLNS